MYFIMYLIKLRIIRFKTRRIYIATRGIHWDNNFIKFYIIIIDMTN